MSPVSPARLIAAGGVAAAALIAATPGLAQQMSYEGEVYEYAEPIAAAEAQPETETETEFVSELVVQQVAPPGDAGNGDYADYSVVEDMAEDMAEYEEGFAGAQYPAPPLVQAAPSPHPAMPHPAYPHTQGYPQGAYAPQVYAAPQGYPVQAAYPPMPPVLDRDAWIADCRAYLREHRRRGDRGALTGGLLGAAAGGVLGNRIADGERLGGTLIGAGVGGLVGLFIGQAIAQAGGDGTKKDCKHWLRTYEESLAAGGQWGGFWSGYRGGYVVVPYVTIVVEHGPQMVPVVREVVRERVVEERVVTYRKETPPPASKAQPIKQKPVKASKGG